MASYRIAHGEGGNYYVVKLGGKGGCKATILPSTPRMVAKTYCESIEDIVDLDQFETVRVAPGSSLGAIVRT